MKVWSRPHPIRSNADRQPPASEPASQRQSVCVGTMAKRQLVPSFPCLYFTFAIVHSPELSTLCPSLFLLVFLMLQCTCFQPLYHYLSKSWPIELWFVCLSSVQKHQQAVLVYIQAISGNKFSSISHGLSAAVYGKYFQKRAESL